MTLLEGFALPLPAGNHTRLFMVVACGYLLGMMVFNFRHQLDFLRVGKQQWERGYVLGLWRVPTLDPPRFIAVGAVLCLALLLVCLGWYPRVWLVVAVVLYFLYFGQILHLSYIRRKTHIVPIVLTILACSPGLTAPMDATVSPWPLFLIKTAVTMVYFSSAVFKLNRTGVRWADGHTLQTALWMYYLQFDIKAAHWVARAPRLCLAFSALILFVEATFWIVLFVPALTYAYLAVLFGFHLTSSILFHIHYLKYFTTAYFAFLTGPLMILWERLA